jgi:hypothetical protein
MSFGFPIAKFAPGQGRIKAFRILGILGVIAGIVCLVWSAQQSPEVIWYLVGGVLAVIGVGLILLARRSGWMRVFVCPRGLVMVCHGEVATCEWDQIKEVHESGRSSPGAAEGTGARLVIERSDGTTFSFDEKQMPEIHRLGQLLCRETERRSIPWTKGEGFPT